MYFYLEGHPDIYLPSRKEPHFFATLPTGTPGAERRYVAAKMIDNEKDYLKLFKKAQPNHVTGEASVSNLADQYAALKIKKKVPHAKIIVLLREPVERAYSGFLMAVREGREKTTSFYEALMEDYDHMLMYSGAGSVYVWPGLYFEQVKRYLDTFGSDMVRIYLTEDLSSDTSGTVKNVCSFLGVPFNDGNFFDPRKTYHGYGAPRNTLFKSVLGSLFLQSLVSRVAPMKLLYLLRERLVDNEHPKPPLDSKAREFLKSLYHDDILRLQDLIGRDLQTWLE